MITNILIILSGPIVSFYIIMAGKNFRFNNSSMKYVVLGTAIALAVSILAHYIVRNNSKKANILSVIASVSIYALLTIATASGPETKMWLPVIFIFLPLFSLPIAISVSIGIGRIMQGDKNNKIQS